MANIGYYLCALTELLLAAAIYILISRVDKLEKAITEIFRKLPDLHMKTYRDGNATVIDISDYASDKTNE